MRLEPDPGWADDAIVLFVLTPEDVSGAYVRWLNDPDIGQFLESRFTAHDIASTRAFVSAQLDNPNVLFLGIRDKASGAHVGNIKLGPIDRQHGTADIGILIGERAVWGRGVATRAIALLAAIAANQLGLRKLTAGCYAANGGSERAFVRAGFTVEGRRPAQFLMGGTPEDMVLMGRLL